MKSKFFFIIPLLFLFACNDGEDAKQVETKIHPALVNPVIKPYTDAIALAPDDAELYFQRAEMLNKLELPDLVAADLMHAVKLAPDNGLYRESLATLLIDEKKVNLALEQIKYLQQKAPTDTNFILMEAEAQLAGGNLQAADIIIQKLLIAKPNNPYILLNASKLKAEQKDTSAAIAYAKTLVKSAPTFYDGIYQLADLYSSAKDKEALNWYHHLYKLDTLNAYPYYDAARFYESIGDKKMAKQYFVNAIMVDRDFVKAYLDYGKMLITEDSIEKADRQFQIATEVAPANADAYYYKGQIYLKKGNKDLAKKFFEQALIFNTAHEQAKKELAKMK